MESTLQQATDQSWRACFEQLAPKLVLYARQWVISLSDAEDVVQNAFVRFWRHQPQAGPEHYPLLFAAVRSCAVDLLRSQERRNRREADERVEVLREDAPCFDAVTAEGHEHAEAIQAALERLPQPQREVVVLKIWGELTFAQIAQSMDESINTIASRYRYALEALRRHIKPNDQE